MSTLLTLNSHCLSEYVSVSLLIVLVMKLGLEV